jgi:hypothetical protein
MLLQAQSTQKYSHFLCRKRNSLWKRPALALLVTCFWCSLTFLVFLYEDRFPWTLMGLKRSFFFVADRASLWRILGLHDERGLAAKRL